MTESTRPHAHLERELTRIWERILQRAPIGVQDDFFDLGGTSVQAARIFAGIEESFQMRLPISILLGAPTIEQLAVSLLPGKSRDRHAFVVPIQPGDGRPPLFCVGGGASWRAVSECMGADQPVYSIGLEPGAVKQMKGPNALEKLVRNMVSALCETQTQGPYYLCGYCQDGLFAYELARQLVMYGHEVGLLAMVETRNPAPHFRVRVVNSVRRNAMRAAFQADQLCRLAKNGNRSEYVRARREQWRRFLLRLSTRVTPRGKLRARQSSRLDVQEFLYLEACFSKPKPLSCRTAIFRCAEWPIPSGGDPYFGWRELLTGRAETYEIPGDHEGIFREPNVRALAAKLKACLRDASHAETPTYEVTMDAVRSQSRT